MMEKLRVLMMIKEELMRSEENQLTVRRINCVGSLECYVTDSDDHNF